jgi:hypothetical protein
MAPYLRSSFRIISLLLRKYSAPSALSSSLARISSGQWGCFAASFCASTISIPFESHLVNGHSHIPLRSGLLISVAINLSGVRPARSSQSGTYPASGANRSGGSAVLLNFEFVVVVVVRSFVEEKPKTAMGLAIDANANAAIESLMILDYFVLVTARLLWLYILDLICVYIYDLLFIVVICQFLNHFARKIPT